MNIKKILVGGVSTVVVMLVVAVSAFAVVVGTNGGFEQNDIAGNFVTVNSPDNGTSIPGWNVSAGSVDHIDDYWQPSEGEQSIDLSGDTAGTISQTFATTVGATYTVTFDLSGNPDGVDGIRTVNVSATDGATTPYTFDTSAIGHAHNNMMWTPKQYIFVATTTSNTLTFASQDNTAFGPAIDNVVIDEVLPTPSVTPVLSPTLTPTPNPFAVPAECTGSYGTPIVGTSGSDLINGTSGNDLIFALGGSDKVDGKNGDDCIVGGAGSDKLIGGNGTDVILGGAGSDSIEGNNQADKLYGEEGADSLKGGNHSDELFGGADSDSLHGEDGADTLNGDGSSDSLHGGNGNDTLIGGTGVDSANGNAGNMDSCVAESESSCEL